MDPSKGHLPRFARGFLVSESAIHAPEGDWITYDIAGLRIVRAPEVPLATARHGRHFLVVLGTFIDTLSWASPEAAASGAVQALARSEREFLEITDGWCGRFLVIFGVEAARKVMTDATAMRSAFYPVSGPFVLGSHARLVATVTGAERSPIVDAFRSVVRTRQRGHVLPMPGRLTPWSGIVYLTANMVLDIDSRTLRRIFPRESLQERPAADVASLIAPRLRGQANALVESGRPVAMSITAGVDSRASLAASRDVRDAVQYFTYRRGERSDEDVATARTIASALQLNHRVLEIPNSIESPELDAAIREATFLSHGRAIVAAYRATFAPDTVHIRSNIGEVGRCFYRRTWVGGPMPASPAQISSQDLARLWAPRIVSESVVEAFDEWINAIRFRDIRNVDALDIFYWEHRMSCWHSNVVLESDFAFDTHALFNSRWILAQMLSVPARDRCRDSIFAHLVQELWPELARWRTHKRSWRSTLISMRYRLASLRSHR